MKKYKQILKESFASGQIKTAIIKTCNILSKRIGKRICLSLIPVDVIKSTGERLTGLVGVFGSRMIRFNWQTLDRSSKIVSIDYWLTIKKAPDYTLYVGEFNIIQILNNLEQFLKNPTVGQVLSEDVIPQGKEQNFHPDVKASIKAFFDDMGLGEGDISNRRVSDLYNNYVFWYKENPENSAQYKVVSSATFRNFVISYLSKYGIKNIFMKEVKVVEGKKEKIIISDKTEEKHFDQEIYKMNLEDKVEFAKQSVNMVVQALSNCLIIGGTAGIGKTTLVNNTLKEIHGVTIVSLKGDIAKPVDLYKFLYRTNGKNTVIVADDSDIILTRQYAGIMKAATDTGKRIVTYMGKDIQDDDIVSNVKSDDVLDRALGNYKGKDKKIKYPTSFELQSRWVIITNLSKKKVDPALISRGIYIELIFDKQDILDSLRRNIKDILPEYADILDESAKIDIIDFLESYASQIHQIDYRLFKIVCMFRALNPPSPLWKKLAINALR